MRKIRIPKLTPRLALIASLVQDGATVADIGTDHAYIPIYLVNSGIAKHAVASDKSIGPLKIAEENIKLYGCEDKILVLQSDGLAAYAAGAVDTIIIAGMGGLLIAEILEGNKYVAKSAKRLILQPMTAGTELREYLVANGYIITDEKVAREKNKFYYCLCVENGGK